MPRRHFPALRFACCHVSSSSRAQPTAQRRLRPRQLVLFPYETKPAVATTFDVRFSLPDIAINAIAMDKNRAPASVPSVPPPPRKPAAGVGSDGQLRKVGSVHSSLVKWRMRRWLILAIHNIWVTKLLSKENAFLQPDRPRGYLVDV